MVGVFGVINYSVAQRTHEIGIRLALGAQRRDVFKPVVGQGLILVLLGVAFGSGGAFVLTRLLTSLLFGVSPTDPGTFIVVVGVAHRGRVVGLLRPGPARDESRSAGGAAL